MANICWSYIYIDSKKPSLKESYSIDEIIKNLSLSKQAVNNIYKSECFEGEIVKKHKKGFMLDITTRWCLDVDSLYELSEKFNCKVEGVQHLANENEKYRFLIKHDNTPSYIIDEGYRKNKYYLDV